MAGPSMDDLQSNFSNMLDQTGLNVPLDPQKFTDALEITNPLAGTAIDFTEGAGAQGQTPSPQAIGAQPSLLSRFVAWLESLFGRA